MEHDEGQFEGAGGLQLYYKRWRPHESAQFPVPLLILVGGADRTAPPQASKSFFQQVKSTDKELHVYPGAYTNLLSDSVSEAVLNDIDSWLDRHV